MISNIKSRGFDADALLSPQDALHAYFSRVQLAAPSVQTAKLDDALGRVLAVDVSADRDYPHADRSAMDGYAVASAATPGRLRAIGAVRMGELFAGEIKAGEAVAIPTGGIVPRGADAVVPIEEVRVDGAFVEVDKKIPHGDSINKRGGDMRAGELLLQRGRRIGAPEMSLLATLGLHEVDVFARPRVTVLSSGDELVDVQTLTNDAQIRDSNRYAIAASLRAMGADVFHGPIVRDERGALERALRDALASSDAVVLSAGSSVGERDHTPAAIAALGNPGVVVHGLRIKPGKPTVFAAIGGKPIVGLPGNPVSASIVLEAIAAPIFGALTGALVQPGQTRARLAQRIETPPGWTWYVPVAITKEEAEVNVAHPLPLRSAWASLLARASGYVVVDATRDAVEAGERIRVVHFLSGGAVS